MFPFGPKKPLYGFRAKCLHSWRHIHLFVDEQEDFLFFRPRNEPPNWIGTFWGDHRTYWSAEEHNWKRVERRLRPQLAGTHFWRVLYLDDPHEGQQRIWRILWRPDFGYIEPSGQSSEQEGAYFWPHPAKFNLWKTPTVVLQQHFAQEWNDPQSDVRSALLWCDLSHEERNRQALVWKR